MDYRDVEGRFDRVASIEMFEAVGEVLLARLLLGKIRDVLSPGGRAGLQIITIRDDLFKRLSVKRSDFMRKYVFPGGMLPSEKRSARGNHPGGPGVGGRSRGLGSITPTPWPNGPQAVRGGLGGHQDAQGFDERFRRLWSFYLRYCEAAFRTERTNVVQLSLART